MDDQRPRYEFGGRPIPERYVAEILKALDAGASRKSMMEKYGVSYGQVARIQLGITYHRITNPNAEKP